MQPNSLQYLVSSKAHAESMRWYAIADAAQNAALPNAIIQRPSMAHRCLFNTPEDSPLAAKSPHLVALPAPATAVESPAWKWIERNAPHKPCITVLASPLEYDALHSQLQQWTEVLLPDGDSMHFAFWDPAILATLVGHATDTTLYVPGPVLNVAQRDALLQDIQSWWYWDRDGGLQQINTAANPVVGSAADTAEAVKLPLQLNQDQVDMLVEASVPDHVLSHLQENQPGLFHDFPDNKRYGYVQRMLTGAKQLGLTAMKDWVNFVCLGLIYRQRMGLDPQILQLLQQVQNKTLTLDEAMPLMPE